jgi:hypothetical protein
VLDEEHDVIVTVNERFCPVELCADVVVASWLMLTKCSRSSILHLGGARAVFAFSASTAVPARGVLRSWSGVGDGCFFFHRVPPIYLVSLCAAHGLLYGSKIRYFFVVLL